MDFVWINIHFDRIWAFEKKINIINSTFRLCQFNPKTGELLKDGIKVWNSASGRHIALQQIYKKDEYYYRMTVEGGMEKAHHDTITRSNDI